MGSYFHFACELKYCLHQISISFPSFWICRFQQSRVAFLRYPALFGKVWKHIQSLAEPKQAKSGPPENVGCALHSDEPWSGSLLVGNARTNYPVNRKKERKKESEPEGGNDKWHSNIVLISKLWNFCGTLFCDSVTIGTRHRLFYLTAAFNMLVSSLSHLHGLLLGSFL